MTKQKQQKSSMGKKLVSLEKKLAGLTTGRRKAPKKRTPFGNVGSIVGRAAGSMFGNGDIGSGVGRWLGTGIGSIFGSGDYTVAGSAPAYNVLTAPTQIPKFSTTHSTNIVCHREYLGDIQGTSAFNNVLYPLNPGISGTFPWLSAIADNYQEYKFHGLVFEFRSLVTDFVTSGAPGVVVMATNYNADVPAYISKQQMENSEFAVSIKPTSNLIHGVECATQQTTISQRYVRTGSVPTGQDLRLYDYGNFQFATQANPVQDLGELWVSYCVEFFKPILPLDVASSPVTGHSVRSVASNASPLGTIQGTLSGNIGLACSSLNVSFNANPGEIYVLSLNWFGTSTAALNVPGLTLTGLVPFNLFQFGGNSNQSAGNGATGVSLYISYGFKCNLVNPGIVNIAVGSGVVPLNSTVDILVSQLDSSITN
jgi:hypothetical protein